MQFIILQQEDTYYITKNVKNAMEALCEYILYYDACGNPKVFNILCESGKMNLAELITYANQLILPQYATIKEIYVLGESVFGKEAPNYAN